MLTQDQKWFIMTTIGVPWTEFAKIDEKDQEYLLSKAEEIKAEQIRSSQNNPQLSPPNYS